MHKVTSASGANLGPVGQCDLTLSLKNKQFTDKFIILQVSHRNIFLGFNWQCSYGMGCNWNVNGHQYTTHNKFVCTSTGSLNMNPIVQNSAALTLPSWNIFVISVQALARPNTKHIYQLDVTNDLISGIITLTVDHKIDHKHPKLLKIPLINTEHHAVHFLRKTIPGNLQPIKVEDFKVSNISLTTYGTADTINSPVELPCMLLKSSFQPEHNNMKHSVV